MIRRGPMAENYMAKLTELRTEAMKDLGSCEPFLIVKALDEAVAALGGERIIGAGIPADHMARPSHNTFSPGKIRRRLVVPQRVSQSDAAEAALLANQAPMPVGLLMEAAIGKGANIQAMIRWRTFDQHYPRTIASTA